MIAPVKKSVNHLRYLTVHARNVKTDFRRHFCSGFAFDSITLYSLLAIFNDSSEAIRTKGMKDQLCAIFNISKTKKDFSKRKTPFFCILKGL